MMTAMTMCFVLMMCTAEAMILKELKRLIQGGSPQRR